MMYEGYKFQWSRRRSALLQSVAVLGVCAAFSGASAQTAGATGEGLQEVVITAEHRKENVQETPIAMSVYDNESLKRDGVTDLTGLATIAPDINITISEGQPIIAIRGISSRDTTENGDPAITVNTDGFYVNRPYGLDSMMYDLDRIEVLRGPQGTLNGRNAVGGALNIVTAKPQDKFAAYTSLQYGDYNDLEFQGMLNAPVSDKVQVRASFLSVSHDGYRDNSPQSPGDAADNKSGRVQIAFEPTDKLHALVTAQYTSEQSTGDILQYIPFSYASSGALDHSLPTGINGSKFTLGTQPFLYLRDAQVRGNLVYDLNDVEITLLGGYDWMDYRQGVDQTLSNDSSNAFQFRPSQSPTTYNGEVRIASTAPGPFQWQVGGFYFSEAAHLYSGNVSQLANGSIDYTFGFVYGTQSHSEAGYAQASYQLTPELKLTGGARYTHDYKAESGYYGALTSNIVFGTSSGSASSSKPTFHTALDYDLTAANMLYAKFDTGYKAGGFNVGASTYQPETINAYEIGAKNRFLSNSLQVNLSAFYNDYSNQQVSAYATLVTGQPVALTLNAGSSRTYGLESEIIYALPSDWLLNVTANYLNARYTNFVAVADPSDPAAHGNVQLSGNTPPQSPIWSLGMGLERDWTVYGGKLTTRVQSKAQAATNFSFYNFPDSRQKSYTMSDAYLVYQPDATRWKLTAFVRNLENSTVFRDAEESQYAGGYGYEFFAPRTYGARFEYSW